MAKARAVSKKEMVADGKTIHYGKIDSCTYKTEWLNPISKKIIYYHEVITNEGHVCTIGTIDKNSIRIKKGSMIEYTIDEKGKTRLLSSSNDANKIAEAAVNSKQAKEQKIYNSGAISKTRAKNQEMFLGYAWSYAKDLVIAGKTMKDVAELNKVARYIYDEIGKILNNE